MKLLAVFALMMQVAVAAAAERQVVVLSDPAGDDDGDGTLVYPARPGFTRGDLDLRSLRIVRDGDLYRIEASFDSPVRDPATVVSDVGTDSLSNFARRGFYAFNLDLYFDIDRVAGAGNVFTLPGRGALIDERFAWERAVVLTPRPELMRQQLIDALADARASRDTESVAQQVDAAIHFATQVRVRGRTVSFAVPASFLAGSRHDSDWAVTAFVTGAKTSHEADLDLFRTRGNALDRLTLGVMQPASGRPRDSFGYTGRQPPLPIVDLLSRDPQRRLLDASAPLVAHTWSAAGAAGVAGSAKPVRSLLAGSGEVVAPQPAAAPVNAPAPVAPVPATGAGTPAAAPAAPAPSTASPQPAPAAPAVRPAIAERLRQLKQLYDDKLIDEAEYRQQRQRILSEL